MNFNHPSNGFRPIGRCTTTPIENGYQVRSVDMKRTMYFDNLEYANGYASGKVRDGSCTSTTVFNWKGWAVGGAGPMFQDYG